MVVVPLKKMFPRGNIRNAVTRIQEKNDMVLVDWLVVASLLVSLFAVVSAIAVARRLKETQEIVDVLFLWVQLEIMLKHMQEGSDGH